MPTIKSLSVILSYAKQQQSSQLVVKRSGVEVALYWGSNSDTTT